MSKSKKKLISNIIYGVVIALLLCVVVMLFAGRVQNRPAFIFGKAAVWIISDSMEDMIEAQSYIIVEPVDPDDIKVGDVIMFYSDDPSIKGSLNTHEVIEVLSGGKEFKTKGRNNPVEDRYTAKAENVVGRYVRNAPFLTALMRFFLTKLGLVTILTLFLASTLAMCVPDIVKAKREADEKSRLAAEAEKKRLIDEEVERLKKADRESSHDIKSDEEDKK